MGAERRRMLGLPDVDTRSWEELVRDAGYANGLTPRLRAAMGELSCTGPNLLPGDKMTAPSTELPALDALGDADLHEVMRRAGELLKDRERARQREAIEQARAILADAGLSPQDLIGTARSGAGKKKAGTNGKAGARYANPANPSQVYAVGRGRAPKWYAELKERGELPAPLD